MPTRILVAQGCDPARIACTGASWGGFHTMALLTQFPDLWACGVAGVPFFDFIFAQQDPAVRDDLVWWDRENSGDLTDRPSPPRVLLADQPPAAHQGAAAHHGGRARPALPSRPGR